MKTPQKTFEKKPVSKPIAGKKGSDDDDDIQDIKIIEDQNDFDLPLDDITSFDIFDDESH